MAITENHSTLPPKPESRSADSRSISKYIAMLILDIVLRIYSPANVTARGRRASRRPSEPRVRHLSSGQFRDRSFPIRRHEYHSEASWPNGQRLAKVDLRHRQAHS